MKALPDSKTSTLLLVKMKRPGILFLIFGRAINLIGTENNFCQCRNRKSTDKKPITIIWIGVTYRAREEY
ncbi:MAG: hypothetical protein IPJ20_14950 [Flammeovirgaceae bacterium]|nr:hypothetical protein [Flammeovirgaceae bacterium]